MLRAALAGRAQGARRPDAGAAALLRQAGEVWSCGATRHRYRPARSVRKESVRDAASDRSSPGHATLRQVR